MAVSAAGAFQVLAAWNRIEKLDFDPDSVRQAVESPTRPNVDPSYFEADQPADLGDVADHTPTLPPDVAAWDRGDYQNLDPPRPTTTAAALPAPSGSPRRSQLVGYLLVGSDGTPTLGRADAIYLAVTGGGRPVLVSIPRSLYITNPCTGTPMRVALMLKGCPGVADGAGLLGLALEEYTGVRVGGFAVVAYSGFSRIVDALGGIRICSDNPRGENQQVIIPAGCNLVDGEAASWWIHSRWQDELVDGQWRAVQGDDELSRSQRIGAAFRALIDRVRSFPSVASLVNAANRVSDTFALGGVSLTEAARLVLSARNGYSMVAVPVRQEFTPDGKYVLYPTEPFSATLARAGY